MRVKSQQSVSSTTLLSSLAAWVSQGCFLRDAGFSLLSALAQPGQDGTTSWKSAQHHQVHPQGKSEQPLGCSDCLSCCIWSFICGFPQV